MFVVFAPRKSSRTDFIERKHHARVKAARASVNWYGRCFWCRAAGQRRDVRTRESVKAGRVARVAWRAHSSALNNSARHRRLPPEPRQRDCRHVRADDRCCL